MSSPRFLVRAVNWVGDAVMTLPALRALREAHPEAVIDVLAPGAVAGVYRREPGLGILPAKRRPRLKALMENVRTASRGRYDAGILFTNSFSTAAELFTARLPRRIGYARDARARLLTDSITVPEEGTIPVHERYYYLNLLSQAGLLPAVPEVPFVSLGGLEGAAGRGRAAMEAAGITGPFIGISPGATNSRAKQWPPDRFTAAAARLAGGLGGSVALFGTPAERQLCESIAAALREQGVPAFSFAGRTSLEEFIDMAAACDLFLTNDSGAMHIASAANTRTVAVFGPTNEFTTGPTGPRTVLVREEVECMRCMYRDCPIDHRCMLRVSPERVALTALNLLK